MKMDIAGFDATMGRLCFNIDNRLGHHVLPIHLKPFIFKSEEAA